VVVLLCRKLRRPIGTFRCQLPMSMLPWPSVDSYPSSKFPTITRLHGPNCCPSDRRNRLDMRLILSLCTCNFNLFALTSMINFTVPHIC
jgi:hypothetical protein